MQDIEKLAGDLSAPGTPYAVQDGKVNATTYTRWLRYSAFCRTCHGTGGVGSAIAPDLTRVVKSLNKRQFETIVSCSLKGNLGIGIMPAWGDNPNIRPYIDNPWAYQRACVDGAKMKHRARSAAAKHAQPPPRSRLANVRRRC